MRINAACRQLGTPQYSALTYWSDFLRGIWDMPGLLAERYSRYPDKAFVIPVVFFGPLILIPPRLDTEFRSAINSTLSAQYAQFKFVQPWHIFPHPTWGKRPLSPYSTGFSRVLSGAAVVNLERSHLAEELVRSWKELWAEGEIERADDGRVMGSVLKINHTLMTMMTRRMSAICVGKKLSRDRTYIKMLLRLLETVLTSIWVLNLFPDWTKPALRQLICQPAWRLLREINDRYLLKVFDNRIAVMESGKQMGPEDDMATIVVKTASKFSDRRFSEKENLIPRFLLLHFPAIHTTSSMLSMAIDNLVNYPEFSSRLRQEALEVFQKPGKPEAWTADELSRLKYHDCFLTETMRLEPVLEATVRRTCIKKGGHTFSDGTHIPEWFDVSIATNQVHKDPRLWERPSTFNPDRWLEKLQSVPYSGDSDYFAFGTGRHICPGRFYAFSVMKIMLAYINLNFEVEAVPGETAKSLRFGVLKGSMERKVMFREKQSW
ncbi:cytochrome P450 [Thozetella sp. PMI_491]|nr:cytochrome P450 [Thozetella sp. PMI_491]